MDAYTILFQYFSEFIAFQVNKKILPRQRIQELLDNKNEFFDLCNLAGLGMDYGDIPGAGYIMGKLKLMSF